MDLINTSIISELIKLRPEDTIKVVGKKTVQLFIELTFEQEVPIDVVNERDLEGYLENGFNQYVNFIRSSIFDAVKPIGLHMTITTQPEILRKELIEVEKRDLSWYNPSTHKWQTVTF